MTVSDCFGSGDGDKVGPAIFADLKDCRVEKKDALM